MITVDKNTGLLIEEIRSGFCGKPVVYVLWKDNHFIAHSEDKIHWTMGTWINNIKKLKPE